MSIYGCINKYDKTLRAAFSGSFFAYKLPVFVDQWLNAVGASQRATFYLSSVA